MKQNVEIKSHLIVKSHVSADGDVSGLFLNDERTTAYSFVAVTLS